MLEQLSICHLIVELLYGGRAGVHPDLEPLAARDLVAALEKRTGRRLGQRPVAWAKWFLNEPAEGNPDEKRSLTTILKIGSIEERALRKLGFQKNDPSC